MSSITHPRTLIRRSIRDRLKQGTEAEGETFYPTPAGERVLSPRDTPTPPDSPPLIMVYADDEAVQSEYFQDEPRRVLTVSIVCRARAWEDIKAWLGDTAASLLAIFDPDVWAEAGVKLIEGFWDGLKSIWGKVQTWFAEAFENLTGWLPNWAKKGLGLKVEAEAKQASHGVSGSFGPQVPVAQAMAQAGAAPSAVQVGGQMTVKFENAPPGTRVTEIRKSGDVDMHYALDTLGMMP